MSLTSHIHDPLIIGDNTGAWPWCTVAPKYSENYSQQMLDLHYVSPGYSQCHEVRQRTKSKLVRI